MNRKNFNTVLDRYMRRFDEFYDVGGRDEGYKWRAVARFQKEWDTDAENFSGMFRAAVKGTEHLLDNAYVQPTGGIFLLLSHAEEEAFVRESFRELFADADENLVARQERMTTFMERINERIEHHAAGTWRYPQSLANVLYYMNLMYPAGNYIFKAKAAKSWADCAEFADDYGTGKTFRLACYYHMCDDIREALSVEEELLAMHTARIKRQGVDFDDKLHILVYDLMYCAEAYHLYEDMEIVKLPTRDRVRYALRKEAKETLAAEITSRQRELRQLKKAHREAPDITGHMVTHKKFGSGTVRTIADQIVTVAFGDEQRRFRYPEGITEGYLRLEEQELATHCRQHTEAKQRMEKLGRSIESRRRQLAKMEKEDE